MKSAGLFFLFLVVFSITLSSPAAEWTILCYIDGDNNLEEAGIDDINEMEMAGSDANINIVVLFDRIKGEDSSNGDWEDTRRGLITADSDPNVISSTLTSVGEKNMGDPATLTEFVNWGIANYPANHYALILWNHGGGWRNSPARLGKDNAKLSGTWDKRTLQNQILSLQEKYIKESALKEVCIDDTSVDSLYTHELRDALASVPGSLDIIAFDACLMGMMEVAYELRSEGAIFTGSEQNVPSDGYPYDLILGDLKASPIMTPPQLATTIVTRYGESYYGYYTMAAVDLSKMVTLAGDLSSFASAMISADSEWLAMVHSRYNTNYYSDANYRDLVGFMEGMISRAANPSVISAAGQVKNTLLSSVIANHSSPEENAHGLSIYLTGVGQYPASSYSASSIQFAADTQWDEMLQAAAVATSTDDSFEPNDAFSEATLLSPGGYSGLCYVDDDWYKIYTPEGGAATISLYYDYYEGDIDMQLYDSSQQLIDVSENVDYDFTPNRQSYFEQIYYKPSAPGYYYLRVFGFGGQTNYYYDLYFYNPFDDPGYHYKIVPYAFEDYSGSFPLVLGDDDSEQVALGFDFEFSDRIYSSIRICSNGYLTFGNYGDAYNNMALPTAGQTNSIIAPFWDDLIPPGSGGGAYYKLTGSPGKKQFIVTWVNYKGWGYTGPTPSGSTFQAILSQEEGTIQFNYQDVDFSDPYYDYGASATVGVENETGDECGLYSFEQAALENNTSLLFLPHDYCAAQPAWPLYE